MEPIEGVDLKELVEQCETEFAKEKPFRKTDKEILKMSMREMMAYFNCRLEFRKIYKDWDDNTRWTRP